MAASTLIRASAFAGENQDQIDLDITVATSPTSISSAHAILHLPQAMAAHKWRTISYKGAPCDVIVEALCDQADWSGAFVETTVTAGASRYEVIVLATRPGFPECSGIGTTGEAVRTQL